MYLPFLVQVSYTCKMLCMLKESGIIAFVPVPTTIISIKREIHKYASLLQNTSNFKSNDNSLSSDHASCSDHKLQDL